MNNSQASTPEEQTRYSPRPDSPGAPSLIPPSPSLASTDHINPEEPYTPAVTDTDILPAGSMDPVKHICLRCGIYLCCKKRLPFQRHSNEACKDNDEKDDKPPRRDKEILLRDLPPGVKPTSKDFHCSGSRKLNMNPKSTFFPFNLDYIRQKRQENESTFTRGRYKNIYHLFEESRMLNDFLNKVEASSMHEELDDEEVELNYDMEFNDRISLCKRCDTARNRLLTDLKNSIDRKGKKKSSDPWTYLEREMNERIKSSPKKSNGKAPSKKPAKRVQVKRESKRHHDDDDLSASHRVSKRPNTAEECCSAPLLVCPQPRAPPMCVYDIDMMCAPPAILSERSAFQRVIPVCVPCDCPSPEAPAVLEPAFSRLEELAEASLSARRNSLPFRECRSESPKSASLDLFDNDLKLAPLDKWFAEKRWSVDRERQELPGLKSIHWNVLICNLPARFENLQPALCIDTANNLPLLTLKTEDRMGTFRELRDKIYMNLQIFAHTELHYSKESLSIGLAFSTNKKGTSVAGWASQVEKVYWFALDKKVDDELQMHLKGSKAGTAILCIGMPITKT